MKLTILWIPLMLSVGAHHAPAQGTYIYDQQSTITPPVGEFADDIPTNQLAQSFTPTLSSVGFVRLAIWDATRPGTSPLTIHVNLRSGSTAGPVLGSTVPVILDPSFNSTLDFIFTDPVPVTAGTTYYFDLVGQSSNAWLVLSDPRYHYPGGEEFGSGIAYPAWDLWFQEGIIVPEPAPALLLFLGAALFVLARARQVVNQGQW